MIRKLSEFTIGNVNPKYPITDSIIDELIDQGAKDLVLVPIKENRNSGMGIIGIDSNGNWQIQETFYVIPPCPPFCKINVDPKSTVTFEEFKKAFDEKLV